MVVNSAMFSPQPGRPRRHMPYTPLAGLWTLLAKVWIWFQVGWVGMVRPAALNRSLL